MRIAVLGSGSVGQTLAAGFLRHGHETMVGTRDPGKLAEWQKTNSTAKLGTFGEAAVFADVVVLAVKGSAAAQALRSAGERNLAGKVVIDATNPISDSPPDHGVLSFFTEMNHSLMEQLQQEFTTARLVKAFNSVGAARFVNPSYASGRPTMFICGNDEAAKQVVGKILDQFGWETADMGGAEAARAIEPLCMLWCILGFTRNEWTHAFKLLRTTAGSQ
ncbi:MAG TPA: NAD(P)-binding domain-containing protein [Steroidobacteraceae bacterium]|nr:NAD(P)-binding domain-containing protein [Steroidobacteraceae bacterium]